MPGMPSDTSDTAGEIHLVNPNKPELFGRPTYKSLAEIPGRNRRRFRFGAGRERA